jgi:hypothetical protein
MSHLRSAQDNVQAHRIAEFEEIPVLGKKAGGGTGKTTRLEQFFTALRDYSGTCRFVSR